MSDSAKYPSNPEVRAWGMARKPDMVPNRGRLPNFLIIAWNRAHPDRPYVATEAYHGTTSGYWNRGCRCERCTACAVRYERYRQSAARADRDEDLADELLDGAS